MTNGSSLPEWVQWTQTIGPLVTAAATVLIGALVARIAWQQAKTAREKLLLDLFDKRYAVISELDQILNTVGISRGNLVIINMQRDVAAVRDKARYLFGDDVLRGIEQILSFLPRAQKAMGKLYSLEVAPDDPESGAAFETFNRLRHDLAMTTEPYMRITHRS